MTKNVEQLPTIAAFAPSPAVRLLDEEVTAAAPCDHGGLILLGTKAGDFVLVDRNGKEVDRLAAPRTEDGDEDVVDPVITDISVRGTKFAAGVYSFVVIGSVEGGKLHVVARSPKLASPCDAVTVVDDGVRAGTCFLGFDGQILVGSAGQARRASPLTKKLHASFAAIEAGMDKHAYVGASDSVNSEALVRACAEAVYATPDSLPDVDWQLYGQAKERARALEELGAATDELFGLIVEAAKTDMPALDAFLHKHRIVTNFPITYVPRECDIPISAPYPLRLRRLDDRNFLVWPFPAVRSCADDRFACLIQARQTDDTSALYDFGKSVFYDPRGTALYVVYDSRIERIDLMTGERKRVPASSYNHEIRWTPSGKLAIGKTPGSMLGDPGKVSLVDPDTWRAQELEGKLEDNVILQRVEDMCVVRDLEGDILVAFDWNSNETVDIEDWKPEEGTMVISCEREGGAIPRLRALYRVGSHAPVRILSGEDPSERAEEGDSDSKVRFTEPSKSSSGVSYALLIDDERTDERTADDDSIVLPRVVALANGSRKIGPLLSEPTMGEVKILPTLEIIGDGFIVVGLQPALDLVEEEVRQELLPQEQEPRLVFVDTDTLEPIGAIVQLPLRYKSLATHGDQVAVLLADGSIQRYRVR